MVRVYFVQEFGIKVSNGGLFFLKHRFEGVKLCRRIGDIKTIDVLNNVFHLIGELRSYRSAVAAGGIFS